ncbi:stage V sporulation protein AC [Clostridium botulinum]|uniref:Stage V sporulation protein AC n=1 Tax=Clostridium botulinum TaxID=1491 RepID=A0A9Q1UVU6_CLOBO|nr:stage V sporulation protein AC [Clostridium botulinum]AEB75704.1 Sporulation stage V, protein AC [Clostridium botulinum BKT015925]KEH97660.1 stage V sporulation protein AC [Clostridium botulinum C/D str. Sp77]KEI02202.1 stage V sporulation protein AC [Clostridium botulinum D str. 16868]KLU76466.1 stage V sporulation protein AC [Clostridium botulinum V891]KOA73121.1 stage V sporulation protein AC [Clostridium botulinum]
MKIKEEELKQKFKDLTEQETPKSNILKDCFRAFIVGGIICDVGQFFMNFYLKLGLSVEDTGAYVAITMIFIGALLTGIGIYDKIGDFAGAGSVVPITGFANSIVSPAMEFKKEGFVFGVGAKMFIIAGPVLVYGIGSSIIVGLIYYFINL